MENQPLKAVVKQELEAKDFGFYWETIDQLLDQIRSECKEIAEAYERAIKGICKRKLEMSYMLQLVLQSFAILILRP